MPNCFRSLLSLPNKSHVNASKMVVLPRPLRPEMVVTLSLKSIVRFLMPLKLTRDSFFIMIFFLLCCFAIIYVVPEWGRTYPFHHLCVAMYVAAMLSVSSSVLMRSSHIQASNSAFLKSSLRPFL